MTESHAHTARVRRLNGSCGGRGLHSFPSPIPAPCETILCVFVCACTFETLCEWFLMHACSGMDIWQHCKSTKQVVCDHTRALIGHELKTTRPGLPSPQRGISMLRTPSDLNASIQAGRLAPETPQPLQTTAFLPCTSVPCPPLSISDRHNLIGGNPS